MRRLTMFTLLLAPVITSAVACGGGRGQPGYGTLTPVGRLDETTDVTASYTRLGRLAAGGQLPFIGTVVFAAGPGDSVTAVVGLSLENRSFAFQREGGTFLARYRVGLSFTPTVSTGQAVELAREEIVRVATFPETQRTDESVLFQQAVRISPGTYKVSVTIRDMSSTSESRADQLFTAPSFGAGATTAPILTYQATGRGTTADPLSVVLNSRGAIAYGADTLLAFVEGYSFTGPTTVPFEIRDEQQKVIFRDSLRFRGGRPVESQVLRIAPDSVPLGALRLVVGQGAAERGTTALVSFSQTWLATNFDEVIDLLRYFGNQDRVNALRKATSAERSRAWREFYRATDADPETPENETLTAYFSRVAAANKLFIDEGLLGWQTDRGEVFITLGPPDETAETTPGQARVARWNYVNYRLTLFFQDESGFGRLRLTPGSRSEFERARSRVRRQAP